MKLFLLCGLLAVALFATPAHAILVDDFEVGPFSIGPGGSANQVLPTSRDAQILWGTRFTRTQGAASANLAITAGDDNVVVTTAGGSGTVTVEYIAPLGQSIDLSQEARTWLYPGSAALLDVQGGQSTGFVDVDDVHAVGSPIVLDGSSVKGPNTAGWIFAAAAVPALGLVGALVLATSLVLSGRLARQASRLATAHPGADRSTTSQLGGPR